MGFQLPEERVFAQLAEICNHWGFPLGIEINPHRFATIAEYQRLSREYGIPIVGVYGPLYDRAEDYFTYAVRHALKGHSAFGILLHGVWLAGFGAVREPRWMKRFGSHVELAESLKAYLVVHKETIERMPSRDLTDWTSKVKVLRENGFGPKQGYCDELSWKPESIKLFCDQNAMGTLLDTSTAAKTRIGILYAYGEMQPKAIHFSDFDYTTGEENLLPGFGTHYGELRELRQELYQSTRPVTVVIEVGYPSPEFAISATINFLYGGRVAPYSFSAPGFPTRKRTE